jgi:hypothetical protein
VGGCQLDEESGTPARDEHTGIHGDPQPAEFGPAEQVLQWEACDAPLDQILEFGRILRCFRDQVGLVFGEDASGGSESGDDLGVIRPRSGRKGGTSRPR